MKTRQILKAWLTRACVYFTVVSLILVALQLFSNSGKLEDVHISVLSFFLVFPFGLCLSGAGLLFDVTSLPGWAKRLLHYIITVLSLFVFLYLPANAAVSPTTGLIMLTVFTVFYWIFLGLAVWFRSRVRKLMSED